MEIPLAGLQGLVCLVQPKVMGLQIEYLICDFSLSMTEMAYRVSIILTRMLEHCIARVGWVTTISALFLLCSTNGFYSIFLPFPSM